MADGPLTLGTAGHIDHGKTALIRALTGRDTDRLPEERKRGISIELGYARLELPSGRSLSVVDAPGHERFVRTMVAGATGIDLFLMCIAADDGVMPQTREHWAVLRQLGVEHGVVAITKADIADPQRAIAEASELIPGAEAIPVAAPEDEGLGELRAALDRAAAAVPSRALRAAAVAGAAAMRLHVDRSFTLKGIGTVVTGTLWAGAVSVADQVEVLPGGLSARVRSVQIHDEPVATAEAGQRVALNLAGVRRDEVARGDVVVNAGAPLEASHILDVKVALEPGVTIAPGTRLHVHHGTRESPGRAYPLGDDYVQLRLESPLVPATGDRVIIRQLAPPDTIGGGVVIDPAARRHGRSPEIVERLGALERGEAPPAAARTPDEGAPDPPPCPDSPAPLSAAANALDELLRGDGAEPRTDNDLAEAAGLDPAAASDAFPELERAGAAVRVGRNLHFASDALAAVVAQVIAICERDGAATIASVRDELGTSRKYAQAVLEHMDATKVTRRRDDQHVLRPGRI